eukprot:12799531-Heterocapsa_arctica.AAC.1
MDRMASRGHGDLAHRRMLLALRGPEHVAHLALRGPEHVAHLDLRGGLVPAAPPPLMGVARQGREPRPLLPPPPRARQRMGNRRTQGRGRRDRRRQQLRDNVPYRPQESK